MRGSVETKSDSQLTQSLISHELRVHTFKNREDSLLTELLARLERERLLVSRVRSNSRL